MIHLLPPLSLDGRFSTQDLPNELQLTLLNNMVVPRIVSSSMLPTIQEGDRLELSPPTSLTVGVIVVFRNDTPPRKHLHPKQKLRMPLHVFRHWLNKLPHHSSKW